MLRAIKILRKLNEKRRGDVPTPRPCRLQTRNGSDWSPKWESRIAVSTRRRPHDIARSIALWRYLGGEDTELSTLRRLPFAVADVAEKAADLAITTDVDTYLSGRAKLLDWRCAASPACLIAARSKASN